MSKTILVTGGTGYIGSHASLELLEQGYKVVILDDLSNSSEAPIKRIESLTGKTIDFVRGDIRDIGLLNSIFQRYKFDGVMHFAGLKAVGESNRLPIDYYGVNVGGTIALCQAMLSADVFNIVFSSSATVYGEAVVPPIPESSATGRPTSPYGRTKLYAENILRDLAASDQRWNIALLRYFNPVGAHPSGRLGEDPNGIPNNLLPFIGKVVSGKIDKLQVFGCDYPTPDGTGIRDYLHVMDLAQGHIKALEKVRDLGGVNVWNLGRGEGYSVLEVIKEFELTIGRKIPYSLAPRRTGDIAESWADVKKAKVELGWEANKTLAHMLEDTWRWICNNPNGYGVVRT